MNSAYLAASLKAPVYPHLELAVRMLGDVECKVAVDLGAGAGKESLYLISQGFTVHAFDRNDEAIATLVELGEKHLNKSLFASVASFRGFKYPRASLICACSSLFFCQPSEFSEVWHSIVNALVPGGIFCGHFMGPDDTWARLARGDLSIHSRREIDALLEGTFELLDCFEIDEVGKTLLGKEKHWHTYSVVARKVG